MRLSRRNELALRRFGKVIAAAVLPVLLASLQQDQIDWRAVLVAAAIAALLAIEKRLTYDAGRDRDRDRIAGGRTAPRNGGEAILPGTPGTRRTPPGPMHD